MKTQFFQTECLGWPIEARIHRLDDGLHVLVTGGCKTHVGAVSYAFPGEEVQTVQFPTHRDGTVSRQWAETLCRRLRCPVVVNCGIHYDDVSRTEICEIVSAAEELLRKVCSEIDP